MCVHIWFSHLHLLSALDAYCLLEVYEVLSQCAHKQNIPFYEICNEVMTNIKSPRKIAKHSKKQVKREVNSHITGNFFGV
jgi:hypothetical protein